MGDITKNFSRSEFACKCGCGFDAVDAVLVVILQQACDDLKTRVIITSGNRCSRHHHKIYKDIGQRPTKKSYHLRGMAADIAPIDVSLDALYRYLTKKYKGKYGIKLYRKKKFIHFDIRSKGLWR